MDNHSLTQNVLSRFLFDDYDVRGEYVKLNQTYEQILGEHNYPLAVQNLLGEMLATTCLLTATLKFKGNITLQLQGDGPLNLAVINGNDKLQMRGYARVDGFVDDAISFNELLGKGFIVMTITPDDGERYQSIVDATGNTFSHCIETYFNQSEQLPTKLIIKTGLQQNKAVTSGLLLQVLPSDKDNANDFEHLTTLSSTITDKELFSLPVDEILYRLYHQESVRLFDASSVTFKCFCSKERCESSLMTLSNEDIQEILDTEDKIDMHCDYCGNDYTFTANEIENLRHIN